MAETGKSDGLRLGFLTSLALGERGFVGGLLVTNHMGRPLEFQCTAPVRPNRTQEILYGPTLGPFLLGDVIGRTLIEKATVKPTLVLVEVPQLLELRVQTSIPIACLESTDLKAEGAVRFPVDARRLRLGMQSLVFAPDFDDDLEAIRGKANLVPKEADLSEPFGRVRDALQETVAVNAA